MSEWIENRGQEDSPVPEGHRFRVRFRYGYEMDYMPEWKARWTIENNSHDIVAYRDLGPSPNPPAP